jgi:hypothetical protein
VPKKKRQSFMKREDGEKNSKIEGFFGEGSKKSKK